MRLPSVKTLSEITNSVEAAKELRKLLEDNADYMTPWKVLDLCDVHVRNGSGTEHIERGHNEKSPPIDYVNCGDPYVSTLMYVEGRGYQVGCWGDIVERGNYD